jgi:hypothetical protein
MNNMLNYKDFWKIKLKNGKKYQCKYIRLNFGYFVIVISLISLGFRKWDLRASIHSTNWEA